MTLLKRSEIDQFFGWKMKYLPASDVEGLRMICDQAKLSSPAEPESQGGSNDDAKQ